MARSIFQTPAPSKATAAMPAKGSLTERSAPTEQYDVSVKHVPNAGRK